MKHALFIKTKNLGDAVVLTAAIRALPKGCVVDILCFHDCAELYYGIPSVNKVWPVTRGKRGFSAVREGLTLFLGLRLTRYDLLCQFSDDWRGALLSRLLNVQISAAFGGTKRPKLWEKSFLILAKKRIGRRHSAELDVDILRSAKIYQGETPAYIPPKYSPAASDLAEYLSSERIVDGGYFVVCLSSRWAFKELPPETSRQLIEQLLKYKKKIILAGDKHDASKLNNICRSIKSELIHVCTDRNLIFFSELLKHAYLSVSIDSLAVHLASAHGTPVVAIYGPSGELNWGPWRTKHRIVSDNARYLCRPCGFDGCGGGKVSECLRTLQPERIVEAVDDLIKELCV